MKKDLPLKLKCIHNQICWLSGENGENYSLEHAINIYEKTVWMKIMLKFQIKEKTSI